jgi:hypothetical protein
MKEFLYGEEAVNLVFRRFLIETMYSPSVLSFVSTGTALLEHILISYTNDGGKE